MAMAIRFSEKEKIMRLFVWGTQGAGTKFCDKDIMEHNDYKSLAYVSADAGTITWYVSPEILPDNVVAKITKESKRLREEFYINLDRMNDDKCYCYLLDKMDTKTMLYITGELKGDINSKIDYMCDVLERRSTWK